MADHCFLVLQWRRDKSSAKKSTLVQVFVLTVKLPFRDVRAGANRKSVMGTKWGSEVTMHRPGILPSWPQLWSRCTTYCIQAVLYCIYEVAGRLKVATPTYIRTHTHTPKITTHEKRVNWHHRTHDLFFPVKGNPLLIKDVSYPGPRLRPLYM